MRQIVFLTKPNTKLGSSLMRGVQICNILKKHNINCSCKSNINNIKNSIVVFIKNNNLNKNILIKSKNNHNINVIDILDYVVLNEKKNMIYLIFIKIILLNI